MHKAVIVYDSAYTIEPETKVKVEEQKIPLMEKTIEPKKVTTVVQNDAIQTQKTTKVVSKALTVQNKTSNTGTKVRTKTVSAPIQTQTKKVEVNRAEKQVVKTVLPSPPTPSPQVAKGELKQTKVLTQQEETIAWNIWRSNLQNKIMQDTKLPMMPAGIVFKFSFSVDKYGKVSNVQTWSETPSYTPYAIQYIAPVIRSYQGRAILNFPMGTQRTSTNVTGGWRISVNEKFSTPQDYNDVEKVVR